MAYLPSMPAIQLSHKINYSFNAAVSEEKGVQGCTLLPRHNLVFVLACNYLSGVQPWMLFKTLTSCLAQAVLILCTCPQKVSAFCWLSLDIDLR